MARRWAKPVIVATQVLESMISSPTPTRAEVSDCANAILDGADAVMLSGETSVGNYPIITIAAMASIIRDTEEKGLYRVPQLDRKPRTRGGAITRAAVNIAEQLDVDYISTFTQTGDSARRLARLRPAQPVLAFTPNPKVRAFISLLWGVEAAHAPVATNIDGTTDIVNDYLVEHKLAEPGDLIVIAAGSPPGVAGSTNMVKVHRIKEQGSGEHEPEEREHLRPYGEDEHK